MAERTQNINSSPSVSSITNNDDIFVSQNGATLAKIDYNLLAKAIIEQYTGSTLAGSAQAVKTALDSLNTNYSRTNWVTFTNADILGQIDGLPQGTTNGYLSGTNSAGSSMPVANTSWYVHVWKNSANYTVVWIEAAGNATEKMYIKHKKDGTWDSSWTQMPSRSEIDTLDAGVNDVRKPKYHGGTPFAFSTITEAWALGKGTDAPDSGENFWYVQSIAYQTNSSGQITTGQQTIYGYSAAMANDIYRRSCSSGTWSAWEKLPTRTEIDKVMYKRILTSADDLDTLTTPGLYATGALSNLPANMPATSGVQYGVLNVVKANVLHQIFTRPISETVYIREKSGSPEVWSAWKKLPSTSDLNDRFGGSNMSLFNMSSSSGSSNNAMRFTGTSADDATEHEYLVVGISNGNKMFGFYAYIRFSTQAIKVYSFGEVDCTGTISGNTATIKVATWMKGFGIVRNKIDNVSYVSV